MKGIQIKINGQWLYLPEDFSISLEQISPVFNEQGTFSFPFEIPLEPNRSVFKNIADPFGNISLRDIDKAPAEIWFAGVMLYRGIIEVDEEVELEDSLPVTFLSGNSDFMSRIEGMNCRDVPLDREIKLGYEVKSATKIVDDFGDTVMITCYFGKTIMNFQANVSEPYPISPFCNARICTPASEGGYKILEAKRPYSGVCFYVLYFLDCLFKHLGIKGSTEKLLGIEDMGRVAFFSTQCDTEEKGDSFTVGWQDVADKNVLGPSYELNMQYYRAGAGPWYKGIKREDFQYSAKNVYATNKNFPDIEIRNIIEDFSNAFGVIFSYNSTSESVEIIYKRDVFLSAETIELNTEILQYKIVKNKYPGIKISYGVDDNTAFNYTDYSNVLQEDGYKEILQHGVVTNDTTCYYDNRTGNAYRVKVDKQTGMNPALMEVGGFRDYNIGEGSDEDKEEISINFTPAIINDVNGSEVVKKAMAGEEGQQILAVFVDQELLSNEKVELKLVPSIWGLSIDKLGKTTIEITFSYETKENFDRTETDTSPLRTYDAGYTLGIMRGPGNDSGIEYSNPNYDGENNSVWTQTVTNYSFTSDSCDNYGRFFDYNGTEEGGADQTGRFSLKLVAGKDGYPIDSQYADRGLVSKFLSEYLYFMANKKTVVLTVRMNITQIIGIDFLKRYKIGDFVGFINKVSYTLDVNGVTDATIELYTL